MRSRLPRHSELLCTGTPFHSMSGCMCLPLPTARFLEAHRRTPADACRTGSFPLRSRSGRSQRTRKCILHPHPRSKSPQVQATMLLRSSEVCRSKLSKPRFQEGSYSSAHHRYWIRRDYLQRAPHSCMHRFRQSRTM